jgi:toxin ParE1/3/4
MWQITLSEEAEKDFSRILRYTGDTFGPLQAEIYEKTILSAIARLDAGPEILGSIDRDELRPGIRSLHVAQQGRRGRHFIVYRAVGVTTRSEQFSTLTWTKQEQLGSRL